MIKHTIEHPESDLVAKTIIIESKEIEITEGWDHHHKIAIKEYETANKNPLCVVDCNDQGLLELGVLFIYAVVKNNPHIVIDADLLLNELKRKNINMSKLRNGLRELIQGLSDE